MAKHVILESYTLFTGNNTIIVTGKSIRKEQLLLITDTTIGTVLYNFSDPSLGSTSHTTTVDPTSGQETTTIILAYNCGSLSANAGVATDKIAIMVEETYQEIIPAEVYRDPVEKLRVSTPQSLIDTDFEYGIQPTKWEQINLLNNRPSAFYDPTQALISSQVTAMTAVGNAVVISLNGASGATGTASNTRPIFVQGTLDANNADGWWLPNAVSTNNTISYITDSAPVVANLLDPNKTLIYPGSFFSNSNIATVSISTTGTSNVCTILTNQAHGLQPGDGIFVIGTSFNANVNGAWYVATTPTTNSLTFVANGAPISAANLTIASPGLAAEANGGTLFPRPLGYIEHRAWDGGVMFTNLIPYHGYQVIRQTRRYFRYQSGKGIQFSTGSALKPQIYIDNLQVTGTTATITTKLPHGIRSGCVIKVSGVDQTYLNGTWTVTTATSTTITFTITTTVSGTVTATGFPIVVNPYTWYGSTNRVGMFDNQNGFYFEWDGQTLNAVRRNSVKLISGTVTVTSRSPLVTGTLTKFSSELKPGDYIVIRGMSYVVQSIQSDTQLYVQPEYRGVGGSNCVVAKTINKRYPQGSWNIDNCDGTGASGFTIDLTRMQMFYMDYTWYGAGAIRYGFKNNRGEVIYCHRVPNNNVNAEAYMRSGNLPARYETNTQQSYTYLTLTLSASETNTMYVADTSQFPPSGTVFVTAPLNTNGAIEYINYASKTATTLVGLTRTAPSSGTTLGITVAQTFTYSATAPTQVSLYSPQCASTLSHWGSSVIMDGRFDTDKSYVFNVGMPSVGVNIDPTKSRIALMSIRLGPTVDNGKTGVLGAREIINRMQLTLQQMDAYTTGSGYRIELILNGQLKLDDGSFQPVGGSSLAQVNYHSVVGVSGVGILGASSTFGSFTGTSVSAAATYYGVTQKSTSGGGYSATFNIQKTGGGTNYSGVTTITVVYGGHNYAVGDTITFSGSLLGGADGTNDLTATIGGTVTPAGNVQVAGGESVFGFFTTPNAATSQDLTLVRDIGSSILGGGISNVQPTSSAGIYPDGPDIITLCVTALGTTNTISARLSWTEAQA